MTVRNCSPRAHRGLASLALLLAAMPVQSETKDYTEVPLSELVELDIYAPSVLRSHLHEKGEWMVGYEYMTMSMEGNLDGTDSVSNQDILQQFMVAPTSMSMDMNMFQLMYAPSDDVTLMAMFCYVDNSMQLLTGTGGTFETQSSGMGDVDLNVQVLIVGWCDENALTSILASTANRPILTIADMDVFKVEGAIINLFRKGTRQKFGVDRQAASQAGLILSSQLLQIAAVVN